MKAFTFATIVALMAMASAAPAAEPDAMPVATLDKRSDQYFTFWNEINFQGTKGQVKNPGNGDCADFSSTFNDQISSAGPTSGLVCTLYENYGCGGRSVTINNPGVKDLRTVNFNDIASSFKCAYYT